MLEVRKLKNWEAEPWILNSHYARRMPNIIFAYGIYKPHERDISALELSGIVTYGVPASNSLCRGVCGEEYAGRVLELNRLVIREGLPKNTASRLIGESLKKLKYFAPLIIVSYADTKMHHIGYVYQATNWIYTGKTKERTDMMPKGGGHSRWGKDPTKRQPRSAKHRYVYFVGDKRQVKQMRTALNYGEHPYPKGDTRRYQTNDQILKQGILM